MTETPEIRFAPARRGRIAYQEFGTGDATIVAIPPSAQNIEVSWEEPRVVAMLERFAAFSRFVPFDKLGTGSSDRSVPVAGLDERVDDLRDVMDHADIDRAHLFAQSEGGPMTLLFAATYPDRVESVTVFGGFARRPPDPFDAAARAQATANQRSLCDRWGTDASEMVDVFAPSLADDDAFRRWHVRYERLSAGGDSLFNLLQLSLDADVREILPRVTCPVLVLHRRGDRVVPIELGRAIAEGVPDGRLVELEGEDHFAFVGDLGWMDEVERFVTGTVSPADRRPQSTGRSGARRVRIETLGRFAVTVDGTEVPTADWGSKRARTLLKRLVVAEGWPVTRDELCDLLWPTENDTAKLSSRLSVQLSAVRRVMGGGVIADRQTVALDTSTIEVDLTELDGDDADVLAAYTGEFLPGDRGEAWAEPVRERARRTASEAGHRLLARAEGADAATLARRLIEIDPHDLAAHRALVAILGDEGDRTGAARAEAALRSAAGELGVDLDDT